MLVYHHSVPLINFFHLAEVNAKTTKPTSAKITHVIIVLVQPKYSAITPNKYVDTNVPSAEKAFSIAVVVPTQPNLVNLTGAYKRTTCVIALIRVVKMLIKVTERYRFKYFINKIRII